MSISRVIESRPDRERIAFHSELRYFDSPENKKKGIYPDLCILDKANIELCDLRVHAKGYVLRGSCIQIELKLHRNTLGNASPSRWCKDLEKLAGFRNSWSSIDRRREAHSSLCLSFIAICLFARQRLKCSKRNPNASAFGPWPVMGSKYGKSSLIFSRDIGPICSVQRAYEMPSRTVDCSID
jgi:hypothetical protein